MNKSLFIIILSLIFIINQPTFAENEAILDIENQIVQISEDEKIIVDFLYKLEQEIQYSENEENQLNNQIIQHKKDIDEIQMQINQETFIFNKNKEVLKEVLKVYQKRGPGTFLEILLQSDSLSDFIKRINIIRDLTKDTGYLLDKLQESGETLEIKQQLIVEKLSSIEENKKSLMQAIEEKKKAKASQESYFDTLLDERLHYEKILNEMKDAWNNLKPIFIKTSKEFSKLIESNSLSPDSISLRLGNEGIEAVITEDSLNTGIASNISLPKMKFNFEKENIIIEIPEYNLVLNGNFIVENDYILVFVVDSGKFYEMDLEENSLNDLIENGPLNLNLKPLIDKNKIKSVKSNLDKLILSVQINLF